MFFGEAQGWYAPSASDVHWHAVEVPHTWGVMDTYCDFEGVAWYRRTFVGPDVADRRVRLQFDARFHIGRVWLNGTFIGEPRGGYTKHAYDITELTEPGSVNQIAVQVDNRRADDRVPARLTRDWSYDWWNDGGIVRDVWLVATPREVEVMARDWHAITWATTVLSRPVHYLQHDVVLDYTDRNGILLIPELPA